MCLSDLGPVVALDDDGATATVELEGRMRRVSLAPLVLEGRLVGPGDWLVVHTGLAVEVMDPAVAMEVVAARQEMESPPRDPAAVDGDAAEEDVVVSEQVESGEVESGEVESGEVESEQEENP